ncbi:unnamed protein product [Ixodes persulcatus]
MLFIPSTLEVDRQTTFGSVRFCVVMWASCFDAYTFIFFALEFECHVSFLFFFVESINIVTGCEGGERREERKKTAESSRVAARCCSFSITDQNLRCVTCKRKQKSMRFS